MGILLAPSRRPPARPAVFADPAADSAGPRIRPLRGFGLPSGGVQPSVFSALAGLGNLRGLHPDSFPHLLAAGALRYRNRGAAGRLRFFCAGAGGGGRLFHNDAPRRAPPDIAPWWA